MVFSGGGGTAWYVILGYVGAAIFGVWIASAIKKSHDKRAQNSSVHGGAAPAVSLHTVDPPRQRSSNSLESTADAAPTNPPSNPQLSVKYQAAQAPATAPTGNITSGGAGPSLSPSAPPPPRIILERPVIPPPVPHLPGPTAPTMPPAYPGTAAGASYYPPPPFNPGTDNSVADLPPPPTYDSLFSEHRS